MKSRSRPLWFATATLFALAALPACGGAATTDDVPPVDEAPTQTTARPTPGLIISGGGGTVRAGAITGRIIVGAPGAIGASSAKNASVRLAAPHNSRGSR